MSKPSPSKSAFSLVELLTVLTILSMLSVMVAPAISSLLGAAGPSRAVTEASGLLEQARQSAMRLGTWVWVGVADTAETSTGSTRLALVAVASRDGSSDLSPENLVLLNRVVRVDGAKFSTGTGDDAFALGSDSSGFAFQWEVPTDKGAREAVNFSGKVIGFSPQGEAAVGPKQTPEWIKVSFQSATNPRDVLALVVSGPSGQVAVAR